MPTPKPISAADDPPYALGVTRIRPIPVLILLILATAGLLLWMGRSPICACGRVELWHGNAADSGTSQHFSDWYTPSHVIHGLLFYGVLHWLAPRWSLGWRAVAATVAEAAWEIAENTDAVIAHYRAATISLNYDGDSVLNSVADILAMLAGFWLASRLPVRASAALVVALELAALLAIRDNLSLNVLMLLWPIDAVRTWQAGG